MLIAGPNLTIDRTLTGGELRPGAVLRFDAAVTPGGKGLNVARGVRQLGAGCVLVAFLPGHTGAAVAAMIADEEIALRGVPSPGEMRSTAVILEAGRSTVINEAGPEIGAAEWARYAAEIARALTGERLLVCSGSMPPGAPPDGYGRLCELARRAGATCLVDGSGSALRAALAARPDIVCPNVGEAEAALADGAGGPELVDAEADSEPRAVAAAEALAERGARTAIVTAAAAGAAVATAGAVTWLAAPAVTVRNPVGAGDALVAGLGVALERGATLLDAVRAGMATAAASVEDVRPGRFDPARAEELAPAIGGAAA
jgi:1-phosphofructokinase family hexose kinase